MRAPFRRLTPTQTLTLTLFLTPTMTSTVVLTLTLTLNPDQNPELYPGYDHDQSQPRGRLQRDYALSPALWQLGCRSRRSR